MATDFLRNLLKAKDPNNNDEDPAIKTGIVPGEENGPPVLPWNNDGSMILISKSDLVYYVIIAILSLGMIIMFVEYRR